MSDTSLVDHRIRSWLLAEAPSRAPQGLLQAGLARSDGMTPRPARRHQVAGVPRVWFAVAATLGLVITSIIGFALAGGAPRIDPPPPTEVRPAPAIDLSPDFTAFLWSNGYAFVAAREPASGVVDPAAVLDRERSREHASAFGPPAPPVFGSLDCEWPSLCVALGAEPSPATPPGPYLVWLVAYPATDAWTLIDATTGELLTASLGSLGSCSVADVGTNPFCPGDTGAPVDDRPPADVRYALAVWGQAFALEGLYSGASDIDPVSVDGGVPPTAVVDALAANDPRWASVGPDVRGYLGTVACRRAACPDGVVSAPGQEQRVWILAHVDGTFWVVADATTGAVIRDESSPVRP